MSELVKAVAIVCLAIMAVVAAFAFPDVAAKATFGTIIAAILAIVAGKAIIAKLRRR